MMRSILLSTGLAAFCFAQTDPPTPAFEVAAIKVSKTSDNSSHSRTTDGRIMMDNLTLKQIILQAYRLKEYQLTGGPNWLDTDRFHIDAKAESKVKSEQLMMMLQNLLAERFQLVAHRQKKEMAAYALVVAKGGPKAMKLSEVSGSNTNSNGLKLTAHPASMEILAAFLSRQVDMPVVDETDLKGNFDFTLEWSTERMQQKADADGTALAVPTLFAALPQQLGLRLESRKVPIDILVIDRAEKPSEN